MLIVTVSPIPCTPWVNDMTGDKLGKPAVNRTTPPPSTRSASPRATLDTTVFPVTSSGTAVKSYCCHAPTDQRAREQRSVRDPTLRWKDGTHVRDARPSTP